MCFRRIHRADVFGNWSCWGFWCGPYIIPWPHRGSNWPPATLVGAVPPCIHPQPGGGGGIGYPPPSVVQAFICLTSLDIEIIHRRIQSTRLHTSSCHHQYYYCDVGLVLFHRVTCYTKSPLSHIHVNSGGHLNVTGTLVCHMHDIREVKSVYVHL